MAQELNDTQLEKLSTKRLLALFKSVREKSGGEFNPEDGIDYQLYMGRIKEHLDMREHLPR